MSPIIKASVLCLLLGWVRFASAAPPTERLDATDFISGTAKSVTTSVEHYDNGRELVRHTLILKVDTVHRSTEDNHRIIKIGDTITIRWSQVKRPSHTFGYTYEVSEGAAIRAWLGRQCGGPGFYPINHPRAIEIVSLSSQGE